MQDLFHPQYGDIVAERLLIGYCKELYYSAIGFAHIRESYQPTRIVRWGYKTTYNMWDFQDLNGGTLVPYSWPYFVGIFPEIKPSKIGLINGH